MTRRERPQHTLVLSCLPGASQAVQLVLSCLPGVAWCLIISFLPPRLSKWSFPAFLVPPWPPINPFLHPWCLPGCPISPFLPPWCFPSCPIGPFLPPWCLAGCPTGPFLPPWCLPGCPNGPFLPHWCFPGVFSCPRLYPRVGPTAVQQTASQRPSP